MTSSVTYSYSSCSAQHSSNKYKIYDYCRSEQAAAAHILITSTPREHTVAMNTVSPTRNNNLRQPLTISQKASVAYGWGVLILAGGGAYYFAKRSINSDRAERASKIEQERQYIQRLRETEYTSKPAPARSSTTTTSSSVEPPRDPSVVTRPDPAPVAHESSDANGEKFAASQTFRSRKGDRFS